MNQVVVEAVDVMQHADADPLVVARACETVIAHAHARQLAAIRQVCEELPSVFDPRGQLCDPAPAEIACALAWTPATASRRVDLTHDLHDNLPDVLAALADGIIDLGKAEEIANGSCGLREELRSLLAGLAIDYAQTHTRGQLRAWLARQLAKLDEQAAAKRRRVARTNRRVWVQPEADGMATLGAYLTAEEAKACLQGLNSGLTDHEGGVDAARADTLVARITGTEPGTPVPVQVLITANGPELAGYGPLSGEHATDLCDGAPRTILRPPPAARIAYRPGLGLTRWVKARDRHCRFPGCRRPAANCDLDHLIPHPTGSTTTTNLACLCRYHHRLKTHTSWEVRAGPNAALEWTSPRGRKYTTTLDDP